MARILLWNQSTLYYNVDQCVGLNAPNDRMDVLLVQFFLSVGTDPGSSWSRPTLPPTTRPALLPQMKTTIYGRTIAPYYPGGSPITIDGVCGPQTIAFIEYFQQVRIDDHSTRALTKGQVWPGHTSQDSTLYYMNQMIGNSYLPGMAGFPQELTPLFYL